ncbi:MAG: VOC family protein [Hyphomicrobiaceae bacterium]|nr:VOC family protein [Hyphomicrobiaceae bacterium]
MPAIRYRDIPAAIDWLETAFGFETRQVMKNDGGAVAGAVLSLGANMLLLLPVGNSELDRHMKQPDEIGGAETQSCYLVVEDVDQHLAKATAAGAQIIVELGQYASGGRGFSCRDPEGHIWSLGTYDPGAGRAAAPDAAAETGRARARGARSVLAVAVLGIAVAAGAWTFFRLLQTVPGAGDLRATPEVETARQAAQQDGERAARLSAELAREQSLRQETERRAQEAREQLKRGEEAREAAVRQARLLEGQLAEERRSAQTAEGAAKEIRQGVERSAQLAAELARAHSARMDMERRAQQAQEAREDALRQAQSLEALLVQERQAAQKAQEAEQRAGSAARDAQQAAERAIKTAQQVAEKAVRDAQNAAERALREAHSETGKAQEKAIVQPAERPEEPHQLLSADELKRLLSLTDDRAPSLPSIRIKRPARDVPDNMRRFVGVWVSDGGTGSGKLHRALIVTSVLPRGQVTGFHLVGPPHSERSAFYPFVGRISDNEIVVRKSDVEIVGALGAGNELAVTETWGTAPSGEAAMLKPAWTLLDAERLAKQ